MNSRECTVVLLVLLVVGGGLPLHRRHFPRHEWEEGHGGSQTILGRIMGSWYPQTSGAEKPPASEPDSFRPMAANLSRCHHSLSDADAPLYCCPPRRDADQAVVDFELPENTPGPRPLRVRRPVGAAAADREYLAKYERAVAIMKSLPPDHPHNFLRQANNHCLYCTGSYDQLDSTALFKIHRSWLFFPWHRAFLYFHERILGKLIGDDTFALPYWNWDAPDGMVIPGFYTRGSLTNSERDGSHLPPKVVDVNYAKAESGLDRDDQIATNLAFMYHQMVSGAKKAELFMGCRLRAGEAGFCDGPGTIEDAPHNTVHTWVGSGRNPERENMGAFYSAARDPIFYAHHANIDRLWSIWKSAIPDHGAEFADPDWLDTSFTFYDENLLFRRIRVRDVLDNTKLGYTYQETDLPWLDARPKPAVAPKVARAMLKKREALMNNPLIRMPGSGVQQQAWRDLNNSGKFGPQGRILDAPVRAKVSRPTRIISGKPEEMEEVLVVYGIEVEKDAYVKFDVFVNLVDMEDPSILDVAGPRSREFAGTFVNAPSGARRADQSSDQKRRKTTLKLGVSELLRELDAEGDDSIWVSLVPRGNTGADTTVGGVRIEFIE